MLQAMTIYVERVSSSWLRAGLRIYFVVALLLVAWFGDRCLGLRTKLKLLKGEQVQVTQMTGWLRGPSFMKAIIQLRRIPGGFLGVFMISSAVLALLSDLAVSGFVRTVARQATCDFMTGLRVGNVNTTSAAHPSNIGSAALWAASAQVTSFNYNDGLFGIYYKVDNSTNFAALPEDIAGYWNCTPTVKFYYTTPEWSDYNITQDLMKKGILYNAFWSYNNLSDSNTPLLSTQLIILTSNTVGGTTDPNFEDTAHGPCDIKIAVDIADEDDRKNFEAYSCILTDLTPDQTLKASLGRIEIPDAFEKWGGSIQGKLWDGFDSKTSNNPPILIEWMLNSMVMVAESMNSIYWDKTQTNTETQGCLKAYTAIPLPVTICFSLATLLLMFFVCYLFYLYTSVLAASRKYDKNAFITTPGGTVVPAKEIRDGTPNGLLDWMQHAVHESGGSEKRAGKSQLAKWLFSSKHHGGKRLGVVSKHMSQSSVGAYFATQGASPGVDGNGYGGNGSRRLSAASGISGFSQFGYGESPAETQGLFAHQSPGSNGSGGGGGYFPRKPVPSRDYGLGVGGYVFGTGSGNGNGNGRYQQLPKNDYDVGIQMVRPSP